MNAKMTATINVCDALEDAAGQLPHGYGIEVRIQQGSGCVELWYQPTRAGHLLGRGPDDADETIAKCVYRLIGKAKEHNKQKAQPGEYTTK